MLRPPDQRRLPRGRILVARTDAVGDVLLTEPALRSLAAFGDVTLLCSSEGARAAELLDVVDDTIVFDGPWTGGNHTDIRHDDLRREMDRVVAEIASRQPTLGVIFTSARQAPHPTALVMRLAGVPTIAARSHDFCGALVDVWLDTDPDIHEVQRSLELAGAVGAPPVDDERIHVRPSPLPEAIAAALPDHYVVVHPGASVPARTLSATRWFEVVDHLACLGLDVVVTGSTSDINVDHVRGHPRVAVDLVGATTLGELASVLAGADAVCVGNTGPMHLAAAVGAPVVAAFPATVPPERWRPWMTPHVLLGHHDVACAACHVRVCPFEGQPCADVPATDVADAVQMLSGCTTCR